MAQTPVVGETFTFGVGLFQQGDTKLLQANPTLAAGDFQRSINGGAFGNLTNLPTVTPAAGTRVQVVISAAETTAAGHGGEIWVRWVDQAGAEWCDGFAIIRPALYELDDVVPAIGSGSAPFLTAHPIDRGVAQMVTFLLVDDSSNPVAGLGGAFNVQISQAGGAFAASAGATAEVGGGVYSYTLTAAETNTVGPIMLWIASAFTRALFLEYAIVNRQVGAIEFTYTVTDAGTGLPIDNVKVWVTTDVAGTNTVWSGFTDAFGIAYDTEGNLPMLDPGTYQFWSEKVGVSFTNPDAEVVS